MLVRTMGEDTHLVQGEVYYIGVYLMPTPRTTTCKVGVVKVLFNQLQYFTNRVGMVTKVEHPVLDTRGRRDIQTLVCGCATVKCLDGFFEFE